MNRKNPFAGVSHKAKILIVYDKKLRGVAEFKEQSFVLDRDK